ncbi:DUF3040 domain-containing protein [Allorhizocola rhizosphaerae]|uniref:DUF3040 domain-containing protein n=1 Tax=Allorhizocola rhizosphaerae TaxID=1872709 RepID=UPI000E3EE349|nr:DUF3040 domain-containing protein [Allorhizocola rhizosphaerae]
MPLSEHEQRLFEQIERSLSEDPKFASAVRQSDPKFHARRRLVLAGVVVAAGLALLVYGTVAKESLLGVAGFVVMLAAAGYAMLAYRRGANGASGGHLRSVGGTATRRTRRGLGIIDRLEARWRDRGDYY